MTKSAQRKKANEYLKCKETGKLHYKKSDSIMQELAQNLKPGDEIDLGDGRKATFVDQFAGKGIVWIPCASRRYELEISKA